MDSNPAPTYRVIGVRDDGTRIQIDDTLSIERANDIHRRLTVASAFNQVVVELEPPESKIVPPRVESSEGDSDFDFGDTSNSTVR